MEKLNSAAKSAAENAASDSNQEREIVGNDATIAGMQSRVDEEGYIDVVYGKRKLTPEQKKIRKLKKRNSNEYICRAIRGEESSDSESDEEISEAETPSETDANDTDHTVISGNSFNIA